MAQGTASLSDIWRNTILCRIRAGGNFARATFTRADAATCATRWLNDGTLGTVAANVLRTEWVDLDADGIRETPGILLEGTRTNIVLWNRDMTNAAWTKTTMTAVKDQTGVDGVTNSASSLLATAGNATCLQAIVLGSSQRAQFCYVKRLVGSGTINMTMDNGATWTVVTVTSTTTWTKVTIPSQTLANPTVGFRIVTNADKIAVDYVQNENGAFESSPMATTTAAVVRAADSLTMPFNFGPTDATVLVRLARPIHADSAGSIVIFPGLFDLGNNVTTYWRGYYVDSTRTVTGNIVSGTSPSVSQSLPAGAVQTYAYQFKDMATSPRMALDVGSGYGGFSGAASTPMTAFGSQTLRLGNILGASTSQLYGVLLDFLVVRGLRTRQDMLILAGRD
jgi:hypothetical protein